MHWSTSESICIYNITLMLWISWEIFFYHTSRIVLCCILVSLSCILVLLSDLWKLQNYIIWYKITLLRLTQHLLGPPLLYQILHLQVQSLCYEKDPVRRWRSQHLNERADTGEGKPTNVVLSLRSVVLYNYIYLVLLVVAG